jgi:hypothetical protein
MNKLKQIYLSSIMTVALVLSGYVTKAQTQIFFETMGTVTANTTLAAHETADGFDNDSYTMTDGSAGSPADLRKTGTRGTNGADDANLWFKAANTTPVGFAIEGIDAANFTNLSLDFYYRRESGATVVPTLAVEFWDGTAWQAISNVPALNGTPATWTAITNVTLPAAAQISNLKIRFVKSGTEPFRLDEIKLNGTAATVAPTISGTLNNRTGVKTTVQESFAVSTTTGTHAGQMVKVKMTLATPAQASNIALLYEATPGNFLTLPFNAAGEVEFGPSTGFPLANATTNFKITFSAAGTYNYSLVIADAATGTALAPATTESVTVAAFVNPTISSTLNGRTGVLTGAQQAYGVTTVAGDMAGRMVKVKATLATPAQASDVVMEYEATPGNFLPLTFNAAGEAEFGPATGFPLANATTNFRATFNATGTYNYTLTIIDAASGQAVVAGTTESLTVTSASDPTVASTLNSRTGVKTTIEENFAVSTTTGTHAGQMVKVKMTLATPAQASNIALLYEATPGNFLTLPFNAAGEVEFGPSTGFPLANATTNFKITFSAAGTYNYSLVIVDAATATGTALAPATTESVTVAAFVNPTISSTLNGRTGVLTGVQQAYGVTTVAGDMAGRMVKVKATLATPAQASDIVMEYEATPGNFLPLTFNAAGEAEFGPATGFPLANATTNFRATFSAAGTYNYSLAIIDAASGQAVVPAVSESVTVSTPVVAPTIASTLNNRTGVKTTVEESFSVSTTTGTYAGQMVKVKMVLAIPTQAANMALVYEATPGNFLPLTFNATGEMEFGPATGFPLANATTNFKITFSAAGTYNYTLAIVDATTGTALAPATTESVTVAAFVNPTISSTLNGRTGVVTRVPQAFAVTNVANDMAGHMVKVKATLATLVQASDVVMEYEATPGNFLPLTFNAAGEAEFGPATGFPLANATTNFRATFSAAGTYNYSLAIVDATTGAVLGVVSSESVTILVNGVKADVLAHSVNVYPNPASETLNIALKDAQNKAEIKVLDLTGKEVVAAKQITGAATIQVGTLKQGTYLVQVKTAEGVATKRFVVVR